jgi:hypothetical protein
VCLVSETLRALLLVWRPIEAVGDPEGDLQEEESERYQRQGDTEAPGRGLCSNESDEADNRYGERAQADARRRTENLHILQPLLTTWAKPEDLAIEVPLSKTAKHDSVKTLLAFNWSKC